MRETVRINKSETHSYAYLDDRGDVLAVNIKWGSGLNSLGSKHIDDYNQHYESGRIYNHQSITPLWDYQFFKNKGWTRENPEGKFNEGVATFGPYVTLEKGTYRAKFLLKEQDFKSLDEAGFTIDVCCDFGRNFIPCSGKAIRKIDDGNISVSVDLEVNDITEKVEIRIHVKRPCDFSFINFCLERI